MIKLTDEQIKAIEHILDKQLKVELIATKDGVQVYQIRREKIK